MEMLPTIQLINDEAKIMNKLISIKEMCDLIGRDRRTLWCWTKNGQFPTPVKIKGRTLGWLESTYQEWLISLTNGKEKKQ